ncbi:hypothetical protein [Amycolatopsis pithecellobii]|uniref:Uncharacterized protein n=1 Tax=Amycolatopsis pithecellobii TaxID=664692 RepID=A0A6N7Z1P4_9PSEU|nr:hypothetical protein [Amycolatopsis pithecellobii]MTD54729.1 hypothetical protein [Amycolatopsis pithecellobii]
MEAALFYGKRDLGTIIEQARAGSAVLLPASESPRRATRSLPRVRREKPCDDGQPNRDAG